MTNTATLKDLEAARSFLAQGLPVHLAQPKVGIVCGSGLGGLVEIIKDKHEFAYSDIPGFVVSTVQGHAGKLVFGLLGDNDVPTVCMVGRFHFYEGFALTQTTYPIRLMSKLNVETLIVTNAAGGLNPSFKVGDVCIIEDHINLPGMTGNNPLIGPNLEEFGPRFPPMSDAYCPRLRRLVYEAAKKMNIPKFLHEGIYVFVSGPSYESKAECRFLRSIGADVVGMSTIPEVVVARHCNIKVLGLSLVTNMVVMNRDPRSDPDAPSQEKLVEERAANHEEVLAAANSRAKDLQTLVKNIVEMI
ncbi:MAG: nucleoside phosphorylase domain-containing protein [Benniella sp.]|nr:MAG: nucleoside phosphorylase domain-containing protein [Benniella sp.]